ncbi:hypothetical protein [Acanthopleuribacter pedis]|uniref:Uncharacterized protein n=1 Tax=Acanthopleuribacter pedis TaxID=442870 RepID=A0A8J7U721_9BACT|nr:hypothetical protein [Acanthopleuribacter pedis]MBO1323357.1 hypothetical protein [Acanthopleuribacter pedis]
MPRIPVFLLFIPFFSVTLWALPSSEELHAPVQQLTPETMEPILELFKADSEGRMLLARARKKAKLESDAALINIISFCGGADLGSHGQRRGLFTQEVANFYRQKGDQEWIALNPDGAEKWADPETYVVVDQRRRNNRSFEFLDVAFRPQICVKAGLSVMQTYLVLYHELIHLVGLDPFADVDLLQLDGWHDREAFYSKQLTKEGGEVDAFVAQIHAYQRLRKRYPLTDTFILEGFLNKRTLPLRNRQAFCDHLLEEANYATELDMHLEEQVHFQYNRAYAWWDYYGKRLTALDEQLAKLDHNIEVMRRREWVAKQNGDEEARKANRRERASWEQKRRLNRSKYTIFARERDEHREFMAILDTRFPAE